MKTIKNYKKIKYLSKKRGEMSLFFIMNTIKRK